MMTPFPVPIQSRLHEMSSDVMRTNEKPSFPVPAKTDQNLLYGGGRGKIYIHSFTLPET